MLRRTLPLVVLAAIAGGCTGGGGDGSSAAPTLPDPAETTTEEAVSCPEGVEPVAAGDERIPAGTVPADAVPELAVTSEAALDIGGLLPATGALSFLAPAQLAAMELAVEDLNAAGGVLGAPVTLSVVDSGGPGDQLALPAAQQLLAAGVDAVVGTASEATTVEVIDTVTSAGVVLVSPHNTSPVFTGYDDRGRFFRTAPSDLLQADAVAAAVDELPDVDRVAVIATDDGYARPIRDAFAEAADRRRLTVSSALAVEPDDPEQVADVVERTLQRRPEAVVVIGRIDSAAVVRALADAGQPPSILPIFGVSGNMGERLADAVGDPALLACMRGVVTAAPTPSAFERRLRAAEPGLGDVAHAAEAYDAVVITALAAELSGTPRGDRLAAAIPAVTLGGARCDSAGSCLALLRDPAARAAADDIDYAGVGGPYELSAAGEPTVARLRVVQFAADGTLVPVGDVTGGGTAGAG